MGSGQSVDTSLSGSRDSAQTPPITVYQTPKQDPLDPRSPNVAIHRTPFDPKKYEQVHTIETPAQ